MAQVKVKLVEKGTYSAKAVAEDGTELYFSRGNSSWYDYDIPNKNVGDDLNVKTAVSSLTGRTYTERVNSELFIKIQNIESALKRNAMLDKQIASL